MRENKKSGRESRKENSGGDPSFWRGAHCQFVIRNSVGLLFCFVLVQIARVRPLLAWEARMFPTRGSSVLCVRLLSLQLYHWPSPVVFFLSLFISGIFGISLYVSCFWVFCIESTLESLSPTP